MADDTILGYRTLHESKGTIPRVISLHQSSEAARLSQELRVAAVHVETPCRDNWEFFSGETLPTDSEAKLACAPCPLYDLCEEYRIKGSPTWGVWAGAVVGRGEIEQIS